MVITGLGAKVNFPSSADRPSVRKVLKEQRAYSYGDSRIDCVSVALCKYITQVSNVHRIKVAVFQLLKFGFVVLVFVEEVGQDGLTQPTPELHKLQDYQTGRGSGGRASRCE